MIYEISKDKYKSIHNILDDSMDNIEVKAVIDGINPGWIFVDSIESPRTAMVWSKGIQGFYFVGDENNTEFNNNINEFIEIEIKSRLFEEKLNWFEFSGETEKWNDNFEKIFRNRPLKKSKQFQYKLEHNSWILHNKRKLKDEYILRQIDRKLLDDPNIINIEFISSEIMRWWNSYEDYFKNTFGYCIIFKNKIVNYCICNFKYKNVHTIGIETLDGFRRQGLSQITTEAFIDNCTNNQLNPRWECMESNLASRSLAEKLGFHRNHIYTLYYFSLDK